MLRRAIRTAVVWTIYFAGVCAATLLALFGASWVASTWSGDRDLAHLARVALALAVAGAVLYTLIMERKSAHADPESQLG